MSLVFNMVGGGGGSGDVFAFIVVTFPAVSSPIPSGAYCTASATGRTTLSASNDELLAGSCVFSIPEPSGASEVWTISCSNGTNTADPVTVTISEKGQRSSINISYQTPNLIVNGQLAAGYNCQVTTSQGATFSQDTNDVFFYVPKGPCTGLAYFDKQIDVTNYKKCTIVFHPAGGTSGTYKVGMKENTTNNTNNFVASTNGNTRNNSSTCNAITVDFSLENVTGSYYFACHSQSGAAYGSYIRFDSVVFEEMTS